ncbi:MAG: ImmA/IrrE family metallo-endopeptidase [Hyphomicrobiaceae bacterium]
MLAEYGNQHGQVTDPPVPLDHIVEDHLKVAIEYRDFRGQYPEGDVLGGIWFNDKLIGIDLSLAPEDFPARRGRYRFTLAHELGHWRLHRHLYLRRANERTLLSDEPSRPDHVLRSHQSDPKEIQANKFAAALLMPREMVKRVWHEWSGNMDPIYLADLRQRQDEVLPRGGPPMSEDRIYNALFERACKPLAEQFQVSAESMRIRLEQLGFLKRKKEATLF